MSQIDVNLLAVIVVAIVSMVIAMLWYSPLLFGKAWMRLIGMSQEQLDRAKERGMGKIYLVAFIATLITSYLLAYAIDIVEAVSFSTGAQTGFWLWLGFIAPILLNSVLREQKRVKLYVINVLYYLVSLGVMGGILAVWT